MILPSGFVRPWLPKLSLFDDPIPRGAALNMAIDEALLGAIPGPVIRVYRWAGPSVSFGYFEAWAQVHKTYPGRDAVRRWTGGGVVPHGEDFTYSLLIPRGGAVAPPGPAESYRLIHGALRAALRGAGIDARTAGEEPGSGSRACFENPVADDVIVEGRKIAGGAQRRAKAGFLHQGSIQGVKLPAEFAVVFARHLAVEVRTEEFDVAAESERIASEKYGTREWLEQPGRRPVKAPVKV